MNLNEENKDLVNKDYPVPENLRSILGNKITGNNMTTRISRLEKKEICSDLETEALTWLKNTYDGDRKRNDANKRVQMKAGKENAFIKTHTKDKDNANPTKVGGLAKVTSSGEHSKVSDQIENNRVQYYESVNAEIDAARYLIEYMNNKNNKI